MNEVVQMSILETLQAQPLFWMEYICTLLLDMMFEPIWPIYLLSRCITAVWIYILPNFPKDDLDFDICQHLVCWLSLDFILLFQSHQYTYCVHFLCFSNFRCMMFVQLCLPSLKYINVLWEGKVTGTEMNNYSND